MPVTTHWLIDNQLFYVKYKGEITLKDLQEVNSRLLERMEEVDPPFCYVADALEVTRYPYEIFRIRNVMTIFEDERLGTTYVVMDNPAMNTIVSLFMRLANRDVHFMRTLDEAVAHYKTNREFSSSK